jgi:hypothetical protein
VELYDVMRTTAATREFTFVNRFDGPAFIG